MKRITVFCGSSSGSYEIYEVIARSVGEELANDNIEVVYGGAKVGLMGAVANGALAKGGQVIGVLPNFLKTKEIAHQGLTELISVESMHERKTKMNELCDGVIALPGGFGTLEELFEMLTWAQLGLHSKPIGILNINGYYDSLITLVDTMIDNGFIKNIHKDMILISNKVDDLIDKMKNYNAPIVEKWISKETL
tara:strand:- start:742 stop:1323 length:582 start_codon:yes stop_codon:yes gene_type:complete